MATRMKPSELSKFRELLEEKRRVVIANAKKSLMEDMALDSNELADEVDMASSGSLQAFELRLRTREKKHLEKIDLALRKIAKGEFGICAECEESISLGRLKARPETTLCIQCKTAQERDERDFA